MRHVECAWQAVAANASSSRRFSSPVAAREKAGAPAKPSFSVFWRLTLTPSNLTLLAAGLAWHDGHGADPYWRVNMPKTKSPHQGCINLALCLLVGLAASTRAADEDGWISLFDGKTLKGWPNNPQRLGH